MEGPSDGYGLKYVVPNDAWGIQLFNGHILEYVVASGALGFDGKAWPWERLLCWLGLIDIDSDFFTVVTKTLTRQPTEGNLRWYDPWFCVRPIRDGFVNAVGLTNPGIDWWCRKIGPSVKKEKLSLVASIFGEPEELGEMATMLNSFELVGLEINASCPNTKDDGFQDTERVVAACQAVKANSSLPLILKLSVVHDVARIARQVKGLVEAFSINSVPWAVAFPDHWSPLERLGGGGVFGKTAQRLTWPMVGKIARDTNVPVIGPSVWDYDDIERLRTLGARAISFGSLFLRHPGRPTQYVMWDVRARMAAKTNPHT